MIIIKTITIMIIMCNSTILHNMSYLCLGASEACDACQCSSMTSLHPPSPACFSQISTLFFHCFYSPLSSPLSSPKTFALFVSLFSLDTAPPPPPPPLLFYCALYPFFCCSLKGQLYLPRCLSPGLWLLNNRLRSSPLSIDYFADLQGRSDDDPGLYWEFYGSAVCGEY